MPFITQDARIRLKNGEPCKQEGDICYLAYWKMVKMWEYTPRWTTYHKILSNVIHNPLFFFTRKELEQASINFGQHTIITAVHAAEKVFFAKYVMDYENRKEKENGVI